MSSAERLSIPQGASAGEVVLVVEDESEGYQVLEAADGQHALTVIEGASRVDLVITDVAMSALNGRQLADRLKLLRPRLPVLFMCGYTDDEMMRRGLIERHHPFLSKPFTPEILAAKVRQMIDQAANERARENR